MVEVLAYMKAAFDNEKTLDDLPFEFSGNPGAWKAWRAHRKDTAECGTSNYSRTTNSLHRQDAVEASASHRQPENIKQSEEWNWDGVWQQRVRKGIDASISAPVLYGSSGDEDPVSRDSSAQEDQKLMKTLDTLR